MEKFTANQPNAAKLLESLRSAGYDNYSAIADLIDNSFDANADQVKVELGEGKSGEYVISIADNGDGMDEKTLDQAMKLGSITSQDEETLGKYGMGLITASISIGRKLTVITKKEGKYITGVHDLAHIAKVNDFVKEIRPSTDTERNVYLSLLGSSATGTIVLIQDIDNLQNHNITNFSNKLIKECGEIFRDFLNANKTIMVNRKNVLSIDPMMRKDSETSEFLDKTQEFTDEHGNKGTIRLRIFHLPKFTKTEAKDKKINITNQGFYLMRNNRQVARAESLGIFSKHNDFNRFRAEIYFNGSLDRKMGVNFKKQNIALADDIRSWIESIAHPQLNSIRDVAKKEQIKQRPGIDHTPTIRRISSKSSVLKRPRIDEETAPSLLKSLRAEGFANAEFKEGHYTDLGPMYTIDIKGDKLTINYNADHVFYQTIFAGEEENKDLINAIDSLTYSSALALIGITSSEQRIHLKNEFLDNMSDNLRTLLS